MDIAVIGAGIAGLAASIALTRAGHRVTVYEKSSFKNEIGAAILVTPNGNRVLRRWGFDFEKARPVDFKVFRFVDAVTLHVAVEDCFDDVEDRFGDRMCAYHRVDLHAGLKDLAEAAGVEIRLGCEVVSVEVEKGEFEIRGGERVVRDFVVLADGCHTHFLPQVTGEDTPTVKIGKSVYRWLAPFSKVLEHPDAKRLWGEAKGPGFCTFYLPNGCMMVTYPCRNGDLLNCAVFHDTRADESHKLDWDSNTTHEKVLETMQGCHDAVRSIPLTAEHMKVYTVTQRRPSPRIHAGKVLAIGDTIHHMLPTHAQGGCSALEDAGALEVLFASSSFAALAPLPSELSARLRLYTRLRLPRSATTQILSSTNPRMTMEGLATKKDEIRKFYAGDLVDFPLGCISWSRPVREFWYGYDVFGQAERAMRYKADGVVPEGVLTWFGDVSPGEKMEFAGRV
ncbi:FAD/NAD(P)-binding domain-containing protein [Melanomma pulvis-pyrius CBS 109.77]|uniref:FAD/NAD(P)-binding domain-containing protein n=1 Tax=Melanomma pulvis-pyrius CBS 109.77 TaxID=1314802 RepID=A0A6A6X4D6_9PLEO|nr:FAD/NAD(P)-binding domain-containing protein [Melanomma pulvis-pyrius CBS 109.77]